ncbi:MAG: hypothetical protein M3Z66_23390 [Chloroflexota bacterium]|nr:hypothetical protein [Chloroflexota bacterium]
MAALDFVKLAISATLGAIFLASAIPKLRHPKGFVLTVWEYRILPPTLGLLYARSLPPVELFIALLFLTGAAAPLAAVCASLLLLSFVIAVGVNLRRGADLACGCFGGRGRRRIGPGLLLQDLGLLGLSSVSLLLAAGWLGVERWSVFRLVDGTITAVPAMGICVVVTGIASISIGMSRRLERRWKQTFGRSGRRLDAKTTVD